MGTHDDDDDDGFRSPHVHFCRLLSSFATSYLQLFVPDKTRFEPTSQFSEIYQTPFGLRYQTGKTESRFSEYYRLGGPPPQNPTKLITELLEPTFLDDTGCFVLGPPDGHREVLSDFEGGGPQSLL